MTYTEAQLQAGLARALPGAICSAPTGSGIRPEPCYYWLIGPAREVDDQHWYAIVGMVEDGLIDVDHFRFRCAMNRILEYGGAHPSETGRSCLSAKWPIRAQALADIGAITVEETK